MSCGVGRRHSSGLVLLWLRHRLAATAPIRPLAWEPPYASGAALEKAKRQKKKKKEKDQVLSMLRPGSLLLHRFDPWLKNLCMSWAWPKISQQVNKKKKTWGVIIKIVLE